MVLYGNFMLIMLLIFGVSSLATLFFFLWSHRKPYRIYGIVSFAICIFTFICMVIVGAIFSEESVLNIELDKTYSEPEVIFSTGYQLATIGNTPYYLIQEDGEFRYLAVSNGEIDKKTTTVDMSQCKVMFSNEEPSLIAEKLENEYCSKWLFIYDYGTETEARYRFTIPNEESILNLDDL